MHPHGSTWVPAPLNLGPKMGGTELERSIEVALGAPDPVYRTANKFHRSYLRSHGFKRKSRTPGPKRGSSRRVSTARSAFEARVKELAASGVSAQFICENADVQRLYRHSTRNSQATLNEQAVRHVLRKDQTR